MTQYQMPLVELTQKPPPKTAVLIASGDYRRTANVACWPAQKELEDSLRAAIEAEGWSLVRAHRERRNDAEPHGFIHSQAYGREVFEQIHPEAPIIVAEAVWQYSQHVLIGLQRHRGPVLIAANWSGRWPGLVGALNLRGSLAKAGVPHSILWAEEFADAAVRDKLRQWLRSAHIEHDLSHVRPLEAGALPDAERQLGEALAAELHRRPAILGVFDEGCMGMFNAIIPDHLLHAAGAFKERLSQSALYAAMQRVPGGEAQAALDWLEREGMRFEFGSDPEADLTEAQVLEQLQMYIAAARLADGHECDAIGIQYQLGLMDTCAASDLAEGLLNCSHRPPVNAVDGPRAGKVIRAGRPITHFNEVDECAGLDGVITDRVWRAMGLQPDNTLHDLRWGDIDRSGTTDEYVWVFEISGAAPPSHFAEGYRSAVGRRQPMPFFLKGGSSISGVSRPGEVVWSRIFVEDDALHMDIGRCRAISLPEEETRRRLEGTTPQWPIMHAVLHGVSRDQMMARHRSNHIQVAYVHDAAAADRALAAKAAMAATLGLNVNWCGV